MKNPPKLTEEQFSNATDIIERQITGAVVLFFEQKDPVWIQALATIARPQIEKLAEQQNLKLPQQRFYSDVVAKMAPQMSKKERWEYIERARSLMTHANNPDNHQDDISPDRIDLDRLLGVVTADLMNLYMPLKRALPAEIEAFTYWHIARDPDFEPLSSQFELRFPIFRGIKKLPLNEQLERGLRFMNWVVSLPPEEK
jgi:hypothetical protein